MTDALVVYECCRRTLVPEGEEARVCEHCQLWVGPGYGPTTTYVAVDTVGQRLREYAEEHRNPQALWFAAWIEGGFQG